MFSVTRSLLSTSVLISESKDTKIANGDIFLRMAVKDLAVQQVYQQKYHLANCKTRGTFLPRKST